MYRARTTVRPATKARAGIRPGAPIPPLDPAVLVDLDGRPVAIPDDDRLVHLQLRRFAGCPVCHLHLRSVIARLPEIEAAGVREVVVFHTSADELRRHVADLPLTAVADPTKSLYRAFGVERSRRALLDPRAWPAIVRGIAATTWAALRGRAALPSLRPQGSRWGLPADVLIDPTGTIVAVKHGEHADDQWSVDELLAEVRAKAADRTPVVP